MGDIVINMSAAKRPSDDTHKLYPCNRANMNCSKSINILCFVCS